MLKKNPQSDIKKLIGQIEELDTKWKRALADYQNLEKRIGAQKQNYAKLASIGIVDKLLPVVDDLERAAKHIDDNGLKMVLSQFLQVLASEDVQVIEAEGEMFDPERMDCVEMAKGKKNEVVAVVQKGYRMGDHVIRPAKVHVGDGSKKGQ